ncbi:hypothetical protein [Methylobacterium sp. WSM2598]|uniref:hypothetical protein n=1 Tax=Methylobacterium sp. WSM2598 TaxID=398261 RepID=UPI0003AA8041|nr:hypothetical protein [Methylobacterium sp. WSM2598]
MAKPRPVWSPKDIRRAAPTPRPAPVPAAEAVPVTPLAAAAPPAPCCPVCAAPLDLDALFAALDETRARLLADQGARAHAPRPLADPVFVSPTLAAVEGLTTEAAPIVEPASSPPPVALAPAVPAVTMRPIAEIARRDRVTPAAASFHVKRLVERHGLAVVRDTQGRVAGVDIAAYDRLRAETQPPAKAPEANVRRAARPDAAERQAPAPAPPAPPTPPQRRPSATVPTIGATIVAKAEAQQLAAVARPAAPLATARPVVTVQAAFHRGRVASDFPNADLFRAAPPPGGQGAKMMAAALRKRAEALPADAFGEDPDLRAWRRDIARRDLLSLADLYQHCPTLYPEAKVPPSDGLPVNGDALRAALIRGGSSPAAACVEG